MGFRIYCDNKGCMKEMEPVLDKASNDVFCTECDKVIQSITKFAKSQMISLGQIKRTKPAHKAFSVKCPKCSKEAQPKFDKSGKLLFCSSCDRELENLSAPFAHTIKEYLRTKKD